MKKVAYIALFTLLGIFVQFMIHAGVELWAIHLLLKDFSAYSLGLTWDDWTMIHHVGAIVLLAGGTLAGFWQGRFWWGRGYGKTHS
ncbi:MAG: hypothetical protein Q8R13_00875 [bacterium]|nr:hypothetical protein [bacterium]MDZ4296534.1 hypothetical protein [Patescibacteria group bacterium]